MNLANYKSVSPIIILNIDDTEKQALDFTDYPGTPAAILIQNNAVVPTTVSEEWENYASYTFDADPGATTGDGKAIKLAPGENVFVEGGSNIKNLVFWSSSSVAVQLIIQLFYRV